MDEIIESLLPAVAEQMANSATPYVKKTHERLLQEPDIEDEEARQLIAFCLADEMERMMSDDSPFNETRYRMLLDLLPKMPEK